MDHHGTAVEPAEVADPRTSVEKVADLLDELQNRPPDEDPLTAAKMAALGGLLPMFLPQLPEDPAELDGLLLTGAKWALYLRSDDAWTPDRLDDLWVGEHDELPAADEPGPEA